MSNPLLSPQFRVPFDEIQPKHVRPAIAELLALSGRRIEALAASREARTYENTLQALEKATEELDWVMSIVSHLESVATTPELREAYNEVRPKVSEFYSSIPLNEGIWAQLQAYDAVREESLSPVKRRFVEKTFRYFRRHGAELSPEGKQKLAEIESELSVITTKFSQNVLDSTNEFELLIENEADVAGLPPSALAAARESAKSKGRTGYRFTLHEPSYFAVMTYLDNRSIREQVWRAYNTRASSGKYDNREIARRILELRRRKANLLGYADFADFTTEERMAKSGRKALQFVESLRERTEPAFRKETESLVAFRRELEGPGAPDLQPWDVSYYAEKQRAALYDFNEEDLRPYFSADRVVEGMFLLAQRLFGITIQPLNDLPVWDPAVKAYRIADQDGAHLGSFYADWFPRENKRGGAWMDALITGEPEGESFQPHLGLVCGNLTAPVEGRPALLTHREVETIFHEFGHLLHHCLSRVEVKSLSGTNVAWDFVELPSQIMENWCWEREALDLFARHWETGAPIPETLFERMKRARTFRAATFQMRQLGFGSLDLSLHVLFDPASDADLLAHAREITARHSPAPLPADYAMICAFRHLFGDPVGYGAGYYSYKWAEVLDADAFTRFQREGVFNSETGMAFRRHILSRGNSDEPENLYREFMGRDPDPDALLIRNGLLQTSR